jgi:hypothetical protein
VACSHTFSPAPFNVYFLLFSHTRGFLSNGKKKNCFLEADLFLKLTKLTKYVVLIMALGISCRVTLNLDGPSGEKKRIFGLIDQV